MGCASSSDEAGGWALSCPHCLHCTDYTSPEAIAVGKAIPSVRPSRTAMLLQVAAPAGALDAILRWVEGLRGARGRSTQDVTLVGHDTEWTQLWMHRDPVIIGRARRPPPGGGLDGPPPGGVPSPLT